MEFSCDPVFTIILIAIKLYKLYMTAGILTVEKRLYIIAYLITTFAFYFSEFSQQIRLRGSLLQVVYTGCKGPSSTVWLQVQTKYRFGEVSNNSAHIIHNEYNFKQNIREDNRVPMKYKLEKYLVTHYTFL